ncbi:MAG: Site-specific methylase [Anaerocolumna sp.]|jgi:DNA adenine methylase|nr:Site-specific methylase [Anaerocolumna sp.]
MFYSPLRYPGGKSKLTPFMELIIEKLGHLGGTYIEPFAGGAGIGLELLEKGIVEQIVINDLDKGIYSFWRAITTETDRFIDKIYNTPVTMDEWRTQRNICVEDNKKYSFELGFATFFLNRTNRSGIIKGGVIGGATQNGKWKLDARFNKENLVHRIEKIAERKKDIHIYNKDIQSFLLNYVPRYEENAMIYFDPPYFEKGKQLYLNFFSYEDHVRIEKLIGESVKCDWIITYDNVPEIVKIYDCYNLKKFDLNYSAAEKRKASEIIIFKNHQMIPSCEELNERKICINLR